MEEGFEEQTPGGQDPSGWFATRLPDTVEHVVFAWDSTVAHSGTRSVSIEIKPSHPDRQVAYNWTRTVGFTPGKEYEITGWIKTENLTEPPFIVAQCWDTTREKMLAFATTQTDYPLKGQTPGPP